MATNVIKVEYMCDGMGDHRTPIDQCITSKIKEFTQTQKEEARKFIFECSYVYNLEETLDKLSHKESATNKEKV